MNILYCEHLFYDNKYKSLILETYQNVSLFFMRYNGQLINSCDGKMYQIKEEDIPEDDEILPYDLKIDINNEIFYAIPRVSESNPDILFFLLQKKKKNNKIIFIIRLSIK